MGMATIAKIQQSQNQPVRTLLDHARDALLVMRETEKGADQE